jgi:ribosomal protein L11 methyltransferase
LKRYPALDVSGAPSDLLLARVLDFGATAAEERGPLFRVFFPDAAARDAAQAALAGAWDVTAIDVPDEDWARRSQENLQPVRVGRITILPRPESRTEADCIVIQPSMGFGTGHHATTRLCLTALQGLELRHKSVLDVGTGSGVLAIAAARLGAARVLGIDVDPDAIQSANENLQLNPGVGRISFKVADLTAGPLPAADVVAANLTGPLLMRSAALLRAAAASAGAVIVSGLLSDERDDVCRAFLPAGVAWEREEEGWVGIVFAADEKIVSVNFSPKNQV